MNPFDLTVIIPAFNRVGPLRTTLRSVRDAIGALRVETLLVDDGSSPPLSDQLSPLARLTVTHLWQPNQGSIIARCAGLNAAQGDYVLFLDSDDVIPPEKFSAQFISARLGDCDIVYGDMARYTVVNEGSPLSFSPGEMLARTDEPSDFFLRVQPAPHNPLYRRDYLLRHLTTPLLPADRRFDPAGDIWLYYNLCAFPAKIAKIDAPVAAVGVHDEDRYSRQWEKLGLSALAVMEHFVRLCPDAPDTLAARTQVGECAFNSWRRLPRHFNRDYETRLLQIWRRSPKGSLARLGGTQFQRLGRVLGAERAGRLMRLRNAPYSRVRTLSEAEYQRVFFTAA